MPPSGLSVSDWERIEKMFGDRMDRIDTHLEATDRAVSLLQLTVNGDVNNFEDHPGLANQMNEIVKNGKYKVAFLLSLATAAGAMLWNLLPNLFKDLKK